MSVERNTNASIGDDQPTVGSRTCAGMAIGFRPAIDTSRMGRRGSGRLEVGDERHGDAEDANDEGEERGRGGNFGTKPTHRRGEYGTYGIERGAGI